MTTVTLEPDFIPSSSTASFVMEAITVLPPPISTLMCEVVAPLVIYRALDLIACAETH